MVNITGGPNFAIGEFDEVGNTVKEFASDDAVVVVGTVIDPELHDEIRVTVVATGLINDKKAHDTPLHVVQKKNSGEIDYARLQQPTAIHNRYFRSAHIDIGIINA